MNKTNSTFNVNDLTNDLWDTMQKNKKDSTESDYINCTTAIAQSKIAGQIIRAKAVHFAHMKQCNKPKEIKFFTKAD